MEGGIIVMTKLTCLILSMACFFLLLPGKVSLDQRAANRQAPVALQRSNLPELKNIGMMIAKGEPQEKYLAVWKQMVSRSRNLDIHWAINVIIEEAKQEAIRIVDRLRSKVQKYDVIKRNISQEISVKLIILNRSAGKIEPVQEKIYVIVRGNPDKFLVRNGNIITKRRDLENYIAYLQKILNRIEDDAQLANINLQSVYQESQQLVSMISKIAKAFEDSSMAIIKNLE
jgi:hypothetical protein